MHSSIHALKKSYIAHQYPCRCHPDMTWKLPGTWVVVYLFMSRLWLIYELTDSWNWSKFLIRLESSTFECSSSCARSDRVSLHMCTYPRFAHMYIPKIEIYFPLSGHVENVKTYLCIVDPTIILMSVKLYVVSELSLVKIQTINWCQICYCFEALNARLRMQVSLHSYRIDFCWKEFLYRRGQQESMDTALQMASQETWAILTTFDTVSNLLKHGPQKMFFGFFRKRDFILDYTWLGCKPRREPFLLVLLQQLLGRKLNNTMMWRRSMTSGLASVLCQASWIPKLCIKR